MDSYENITESDILNFLPNYPSVEDEELPYKIARKKEFQDNILSRSESVPPRGELLQQQRILKRYFTPETPYTEALIAHGLGTGKCVHPSTKIWVKVGNEDFKYLKAEEVWANFKQARLYIDNVFEEWYTLNQPVQVLSFNCDRPSTSDTLISSPITYLYRQFINEWIYHITLDNGHHLILTKAHKLYDGEDWVNTFTVGMPIAVMVSDKRGVKKVGYAKITTIKEQPYEGYVFDFEVQPYHNYVANGIIAHNTCTASAIVENYKASKLGGVSRPPALVIVKSEDLARSLQRDIVEVCTFEVYKVNLTERELRKGVVLSEETKVRRLNEAVSRSYEIYTYGTFVRQHVINASVEDIRRKWSGRTIILDEPHTLRIQPRKRERNPIGSKLKNLEAENEIGDDLSPSEAPLRGDLGNRRLNSSLYDEIYRFLHSVEGCVKLLFTGTPIWDQSYEFASLMNLILPLDLQFPNKATFNTYFVENTLTEEGVREISRRIRNRVSYLKSMITTGSRINIGVVKPWFKYTKVYPDVMSDFQAGFVDKAYKSVEVKRVTNREGKVTERTVVGGVVYKDARDASNLVVPVIENGEVVDGAYGQAAFNQVAIQRIRRPNKEGRVRTVTQYAITNPIIRRELRDNLAQYSTKFASIIDKLDANPQEVAFIYNDLVTGTGGAIMLALVLQLRGYTWIRNHRQALRHTGGRSFVLMSSDPETINNPIEIQNVLSIVGSRENIYANKIQAVIGTEKISVGISILNCRQIHITLPDFNIPSTEQAEFRGIRFGSLEKLPPAERYVKIYHHVSVSSADSSDEPNVVSEDPTIVYPPGAKYSDETTIDVYILRLAEEKDHKNSQIYRLIKQASMDCGLTYERNVLPEDEDGSRECDYQECNYECDGIAPVDRDTANGVWSYRLPEDELDYTTYNLFYAQDTVRQLIDGITALFGNYFALRIDTLIELLEVSPDQLNLLYQALNTMIDSRMTIKNRYGFPSYLKEQNDVIFLGSTVTPRSDYLESTYIANPLATDRTGLNEIIESVELYKDNADVSAYFNDPTVENLQKISYTTRILMFEELFSKDCPGKRSKASKLVNELYKDDIYTMSDGNKVHILYTQEFSGVAYDVASKVLKVTGRMRIYDTEDKRWKGVEDPEVEAAYLEEIKQELDRKRDVGLENNPYGAFGWISKRDGEFRITVKQSKGKPRGKKCINFKIPELLDLFVNRLKYLPQARDIYSSQDKERLIASIEEKSTFENLGIDLSKQTTKYLRQLLTLLNLGKDEMCAELQEWFESKGLLYIL